MVKDAARVVAALEAVRVSGWLGRMRLVGAAGAVHMDEMARLVEVEAVVVSCQFHYGLSLIHI